MKPTVIDHIGIAVKSIDEALAFWQGSWESSAQGWKRWRSRKSRRRSSR